MTPKLPSDICVAAAVLMWARESLRMPIGVAARRMGVSPSTLLTWEGEGGLFRLTQLEAMATLYRRPVAVFFLAAPPSEPPLPADHRTLPSQEEHELSSQTIMAVRYAQRLQENARDFAKGMGEDTTASIPTGTLGENPDVLASRLRLSLRITTKDQFSWRDDYLALRTWAESVEQLGVLVLRQNLPLDETRAFSLPGKPPVLVLSSNDKPRPRMFSLAHELVHLSLGTSGMCDTRVGPYASASQATETFCNRVAGAVLVPADDLLVRTEVAGFGADEWTDEVLGHLATTFRVTSEVILRRLLIAGKTTDAFYQAKRSEWRKRPAPPTRPGRAQSPVDACVHNHGRAFVRLVADANRRDLVPDATAADVLDVRVRHLDEIYAKVR